MTNRFALRPRRFAALALVVLALLAHPAGAQMARTAPMARMAPSRDTLPRHAAHSPAARRGRKPPLPTVPTDSLAHLVLAALDAPPERDQELFSAIACQFYRLDWAYGPATANEAAARMIDSLLPTPVLRARLDSVTARWPEHAHGWRRCSVVDLTPSSDDLVIERPARRR